MSALPFHLRLGDCLAGLRRLPARSADVAIFDPPYSRHVHENGRRGTKLEPGGAHRALGFDHIEERDRRAVANLVSRATRRWILTFCDTEGVAAWGEAYRKAGVEHVRTGIWVKRNAAPQFTGDRPAQGHECVVICHRPGQKRWNGGGALAVWTHAVVRGSGRLHPAQKPVSLMRELVDLFSDPGELVLDPFAGAGTTGVAALDLGRRFLGWEIDKGWHRQAQRRLADAALEARRGAA